MDGRDEPKGAGTDGERDAKPGDARGLMADWLALTDRLLDGLGLSVAELQELVAMQGRVNELIERSSTDRTAAEAEDERPTFRRVL